ncbi:PREDICTED: piggyBac transposable element-derived protein 3-like, partial [Rhagoletis zephyria]|uniref:piggyBac transposable element-derived protein 3-like n=1 Tax=Rhagoletis zephyria TaxID=28612 RepID=UPI0008114D9B
LRQPLRENEFAAILEEISLDNGQSTDIESEDEDEQVILSKDSEDDIFNEILNQIQAEQTAEANILLEDPQNGVLEEPLRKWRKVEKITEVSQFDSPEGTVVGYFEDIDTPTKFFLSFIETIVEGIIFHSNLYAVQKDKTLNLKKNEFYAFIGINFFMGYHQLPSWRHYWSTSEDLAAPVVSKTMSRNRFDSILRFLHVNDNSKIPENNKDRLFKIRPMIDALNQRFQQKRHQTILPNEAN